MPTLKKLGALHRPSQMAAQKELPDFTRDRTEKVWTLLQMVK